MHNGLFSISEIASICNISPRQMRHYDKLGIINPSLRDEATGYRYYSRGQVQRVLLLKAMQKLGFSLEEISQLLGKTDLIEFRDRIESQVALFQQELVQCYQRLEQAENLYMQINKALSAIQYGEHLSFFECVFPCSAVVSMRYVGPRANHDLYSLRQAEIMGLIERYNLKTSGPSFTIFHDHKNYAYSEDNRDLEAGVFIQGSTGNCPNAHTFGGFPCLSGFYHGAYELDQIKLIYEKMQKYAEDIGKGLTGEAIEVYLVGPTITQNAEDYITQIYLPLC